MREYDPAPVEKWLGHSPAPATRDYAASGALDADFKRAGGQADMTPEKAAPHAPRYGAEEAANLTSRSFFKKA